MGMFNFVRVPKFRCSQCKNLNPESQDVFQTKFMMNQRPLTMDIVEVEDTLEFHGICVHCKSELQFRHKEYPNIRTEPFDTQEQDTAYDQWVEKMLPILKGHMNGKGLKKVDWIDELLEEAKIKYPPIKKIPGKEVHILKHKRPKAKFRQPR